MKIWIVDYIDNQNNIVKLTDDSGKYVNVDASLFDTLPNEGDAINISIDKSETKSRKNKVDALIDELFE